MVERLNLADLGGHQFGCAARFLDSFPRLGQLNLLDAFWGDERMESVHWLFATAVLVLAPVHVIGVFAASLRHHESLVAAMVHGRKRAASGDDVR